MTGATPCGGGEVGGKAGDECFSGGGGGTAGGGGSGPKHGPQKGGTWNVGGAGGNPGAGPGWYARGGDVTVMFNAANRYVTTLSHVGHENTSEQWGICVGRFADMAKIASDKVPLAITVLCARHVSAIVRYNQKNRSTHARSSEIGDGSVITLTGVV